MDSEASAAIDNERRDEQTPTARGFAAMSPEKQRELARRGGRAAHERGTAHEFSPDEARSAGKKGGEAVSRDREYMAKIGREGARKSAAVRRRPRSEPSAPKAIDAKPSDAKPSDVIASEPEPTTVR